MSKELERLEELVKHDEAYFMDNMAIMRALALILKRQECSHEWVKSITSQQYVKAQAYVCNGCGLKETRF